MSKNNKLNRSKKQKERKRVQRAASSAAEKIADKAVEDLKAKFAKLEESHNALLVRCLREFKNIGHNTDVFFQAHDELDGNVLTLSKLTRERFIKLEQVLFLNNLSAEEAAGIDINSDELTQKFNSAWLEALNRCFQEMKAEKAEKERQRLEAKKKAEEMAAAHNGDTEPVVETPTDRVEKQLEAVASDVDTVEQIDLTERERIEAELKASEQPRLEETTHGGPGSDIPDGAQVFGG